MQVLFQDLRYGLRRLLRQPGLSVLIIMILALGAGVNSALFSLVNAMLLRPLPYEDADSLSMIWNANLQKNIEKRPLSPQVFHELVSQNQVFEQIAAFVANSDVRFTITGRGEPERVQGAIVSANFFQTMGVAAEHGHAFTSADEGHAENVDVILSHRLWERLFGADPGQIGKPLTLNERSYNIIGVMPASFDFPVGVELWVADPLRAGEVLNSALPITYALRVVARSRDGVGRAQVQESLRVIGYRLRQEFQEERLGVELRAVPLREQIYGDIRYSLLILFAATGFVLLIACANIANLLLARAATRQHEISVRAALGATRWRIIRQLFTENVLLAALGGGAGLLLCAGLIRAIMSMWPAAAPPLSGVSIDYRVLGFTLVVILLTGLLFGLMPALNVSRADLNELLKEGSTRSSAGFSRQRLLDLVVVCEIALALLLSIGSVLMIQTFLRITNTNLGFEPQHLLTLKLSLSKLKYPNGDRQTLFYQQALRRIAALPGVEYAGAANFLPLGTSNFQALFLVEGKPIPDAGEEPTANSVSVSPDYFKAMGIQLTRGRFFNEGEAKESQRVVIINETAARRFWPEDDPVGRRLKLQGNWCEIVGVVRDVKQSLAGDAPVGAQIYMPYTQFDFAWPYMYVVVKTSLDQPASLAASVRGAIWAEDQYQPIENLKTFDQIISDTLSQQRFTTLLLITFAFIAVALAVVGIYGVMAYSISQRTHEIGIRMALGAQTRDILRLVMKRGLTIMLLGVAVGLGLAAITTRVMTSLLYGLSATDPLVFLLASLLFIAVSIGAVLVPARKATKIDPLVAMRYD
jgi:putative ABC transport system permease protein